MIPLVDLQAQYLSLKADIDAAVQRVLDSCAFILGDEVEQFERAFATYCEAQHGIGVASGSAALHLALLACGVGPGDEVITTPLTFIATVEAIVRTGARPVFVDIDPATYQIDPELIAAAVTPRTKALVPVHLYGATADMGRILAIAAESNVKIIEDTAQAHGARSSGRRVGTFGDAGCFSFYPGKNLGAYGDGGMVVTNDPAVAARVRLLRDHGRRGKYEHETLGFGERLDALQAAVLGVKLAHLDDWNARRKRAAARYCELLEGCPLVLPQRAVGSDSVYHLFVVRVAERDRLLQQLRASEIGAGVHYPIPLHRQAALAYLGWRSGSLPHAERAASEVLSLPLFPEISEDQLAQVSAAVRRGLDVG